MPAVVACDGLVVLLELAARLGQEDVVERRRVQLEVADREARGVEGADDVGERLGAAAEPDRRRAGRRGRRGAEPREHLGDACAVVGLARDELQRRAPDLGLQGVRRALATMRP